MNSAQSLILSSRIIAAHQIATLLEEHGWPSVVEHDVRRIGQLIDRLRPQLLIADIDSPELAAVRLLADFRQRHPLAGTMAICAGGNSQGMRIVRNLGVDGFFYLQPHGKALDMQRGIPHRWNSQRHIPTHTLA